MRNAKLLFRTLTLKKIFNVFLVYAGYSISVLLRKTILPGNPLSISIEPTNICNLKCSECPTGMGLLTRPKGMIEKDLFMRIVDEIAPSTINLFLHFQGESILHPDLPLLIKYASEKKLYTQLSTNAQLISEEQASELVSSGLSKIIISMDGTDQQTYSNYRVGGSLEKVITAVKLITSSRNKLNSEGPLVVLQFLVFRHNESQLAEIDKLRILTGADKISVKSAQLYSQESRLEKAPLENKYSRYIEGERKGKLGNRCIRLWNSAVITWDGKILPCCFDKNADHTVSNIQTNSFLKAWKSSEWNTFRSKVLRERKSIEMCRNCTEGL